MPSESWEPAAMHEYSCVLWQLHPELWTLDYAGDALDGADGEGQKVHHALLLLQDFWCGDLQKTVLFGQDFVTDTKRNQLPLHEAHH